MSQPSTYLDLPNLLWQKTMDPQYAINSTAISAKGDRCVAATYWGTYKGAPPPPTLAWFEVTCWDGTGEQLWSDKFQAHEGPSAVAISGDGSVVAAGGWMKAGVGYAKVYDATSGKGLVTYYFKERVNALALSYDGSVLAIAEYDAYLAQKVNGAFPSAPKAVGLPKGTIVESISMPDDGSVLVIGDRFGEAGNETGNVSLVENNDGAIGNVYKWAGGSDMGPVHSVAISADGKWFAAVGDSQSVYLFNLDSIKQGKYANSLDLANSNRMRWVAIAAGGYFLATVQNSGSGGLVYGILNQNGILSTLWTQPSNTGENPNCASTDAKGRYVAVATGYNVTGPGGGYYLFDGPTGKPLWKYPTKEMAWPCFISANGKGIFAGSDDGIACYFTPGPPS